ncbi:alanine/glycine:cation symporter family protein [Fulvivirga sedimenti]|uniref:Sodium:alanine symporter family protein n=1 Tax=Fulvivirga sedimenti TaxID=2879465 RepID=A0A9X1KW09_9BACT|nr:sodium:alanine symporter family protein [Fulvivirga sedimenti]MCA6074240.1 sodium:alanine symporter family protein [Fulvivirga sedimenti]
MQELNDVLSLIDGYIGGSTWFVFLLLFIGAFFTIYLGFPQIRYFRHALRVVTGKFDRKGDEGDASHFQALATALSGTVGTGNIGGVALAIHLGGPAALFWMLVTAFLGMTTKFVEVTLSHKYRETDNKGLIAGGPMYYMKNATFKIGNKPVKLAWLGAVFAFATILSSFGTGNLPQINNIADSVYSSFQIERWQTGLVLAVILALVILGGIKRIVKVTEKLVPGMAILYFLGALAVIFTNFENILPSFISIFSDVFSGTAAAGGFLGANLAFAFNRGVNRGLFSNEAGQGSAPIAHAAAKAHEPVSEGMVAILEPFIDTIIICTLTGLVLLSSGAWNEKYQNIFDYTDVDILGASFDENNEADRQRLYSYLVEGADMKMFTGELTITDGKITDEVTVVNNRSIAEEVIVNISQNGEWVPYTGTVEVTNGDVVVGSGPSVRFEGKSLVHSAQLTTFAFKKSFLGENGKLIVTIGLLLFAFSTAISWSYYGDRATTYLFGTQYIIFYRILYVIGFFLASFTPTTIIWTLSGITIALMTIPNLIGIFWLRGEMKETVRQYWIDFKNDWPDAKTPR